MQKNISLLLSPEQGYEDESIHKEVEKKFGFGPTDIFHVNINKRSIDARSRNVKIHLDLTVFINEPEKPLISFNPELPDVSKSDPVIIVGSGPAGLFDGLWPHSLLPQ